MKKGKKLVLQKKKICTTYSRRIWTAGVFLLLFLITVVWNPRAVKAAEKLELNKDYSIIVETSRDSFLYEFTVPTAGNISIKIKNADPVGDGQIGASLYDSNNLLIIDRHSGANVELPVYSTDGNRTFYLKVTGSFDIDHTNFNLSVGFVPTKDWETEGNDTIKTADTITAGKKWYGTINAVNDPCDYFKFKLGSNKTVRITFGPKEVAGDWHIWSVSLFDSKNQSVMIYDDNVTKSYDCYLKKGTYYLKVENPLGVKNIPYALSIKESACKLVKPTITSIQAVGKQGLLSNWIELNPIRIKNQGDATGYTVKVARKKNMKGVLGTQDIDCKDTNTKKQVTLNAHITVLKSYYVQARSYVEDAFGVKIYGEYGSVKCKTLKESVYAKLAK